MLNEKMNDFNDLSYDQCFIEEFHDSGLYPPIILPNSVSIKTSVFVLLSHNLWNALAEKFC